MKQKLAHKQGGEAENGLHGIEGMQTRTAAKYGGVPVTPH